MGLIFDSTNPVLPAAGAATVASTDITDSTAVGRNVLTAASALIARAAIGAVAVPTSGTLAARPASPAAGDSYAVTSGIGKDDRYVCFVAPVWTLVYAAPYAALPASCRLAFDFTEASGAATIANSGAAGGTFAKAGSPTIAAYPWLGGRGLTCPTSSDYYQSDGAGGLDAEVVGAAYTLEAWVSGGTGSGTQTILARRVNTGSWVSPFSAVDLSLSGTTLRTWMGTTSNFYTASSGAVPVTGLHHLVQTWSAAGALMIGYVDGFQVSSTATAGTMIGNSSGRWGVGQVPQGGGAGSEPFGGTIHMAREYSAVLTAAEVQERWARGMALYRGL